MIVKTVGYILKKTTIVDIGISKSLSWPIEPVPTVAKIAERSAIFFYLDFINL